jgi:hypothetical protein
MKVSMYYFLVSTILHYKNQYITVPVEIDKTILSLCWSVLCTSVVCQSSVKVRTASVFREDDTHNRKISYRDNGDKDDLLRAAWLVESDPIYTKMCEHQRRRSEYFFVRIYSTISTTGIAIY